MKPIVTQPGAGGNRKTTGLRGAAGAGADAAKRERQATGPGQARQPALRIGLEP